LLVFCSCWSDYPDVLQDVGASVGDIVPCRRGNVGQHVFFERDVWMTLDVGNAAAVQDHESFFIL